MIDAAVSHFTEGAESYDRDGAHAGRGQVHPGLLARLLDDPYYALQAPKSTGKEHFNLAYLLAAVEEFDGLGFDDVVATVTEVTARTVAAACREWQVTEVVASGGGTANPVLMAALGEAMPDVTVTIIDELGVPSDTKEAYAFALIGFLAVHGLPGTVASCTGASRATVLGSPRSWDHWVPEDRSGAAPRRAGS